VSGIARRDLLRTGALGGAGPTVAFRTLVASMPRSHVAAGRVDSVVRRELGYVEPNQRVKVNLSAFTIKGVAFSRTCRRRSGQSSSRSPPSALCTS
jgi:hypothetical protein